MENIAFKASKSERQMMDQLVFSGHKSIGDQMGDIYASLQMKLALLEVRRSRMKEKVYKKLRGKYAITENNLKTLTVMRNSGNYVHDN